MTDWMVQLSSTSMGSAHNGRRWRAATRSRWTQ
jgi:hypothetical protein